MILSKVNLLQGTNSTHDFSTGNTLPLAGRPWGMHHWTLQTGRTPWTFHPAHRKLQGVRLTHQPSPWMGDYGNILVCAFNGPVQEAMEDQASAYRVESCVLQPNYLKAELLRYGITLEMAPSERGALFIFTSRKSEPLRIRFFFDGEHSVAGEAGGRETRGVSRNNSGGVASDFGLRFAGLFSEAPSDFEKLRNGVCFTFAPSVTRLELRLAGSFIDEATASHSLERELRGKSREELSSEGAEMWDSLLGRFQIEARDETQARTFYSCLYRCLLFPRFLDEVGADGRTVHYSPYDGKVHAGSLCADNGFWDTFRTVYPLLALAYPDHLTRIMEGWLAACKESGWSPKWPSPGLRDCMIGTHFDVIVADAVAHGVTDWDIEGVFPYLWRDATEPSSDGCFGRQGLEDYLKLGYLPTDRHRYAVSATLDYTYDDFCIRQVALHLGKKTEADHLLSRTRNYRNVFDATTGFMRPRLSNGSWLTPFREFEWGGAYIEGGPWQHSFHVPHDLSGLAELHGGNEALCRKLDRMLELPADFERGSYPFEIHEMTEMALGGFGQYAQSNQPAHAYLSLFALAGQPEKTSYWINRVASELYSPDRFPGDEDNGEMAAWYIFAALGIYPACPGTSEFVKFDPVVPAITLTTPEKTIRFGRS